jgi:putative ABC transport system substrate-binding protein
MAFAAALNLDRLPELVDELVASRVDVIVAIGYPAAAAAKQGTNTIPIVSAGTPDAIATGLVNSLSRPGGNLTGISDDAVELSAKRLQLLKEAVPQLRHVAMLYNAADLGMTQRYQVSAAAAQTLGLTV